MTHNQFNDVIEKYQKPLISIIYKMVFSWETSRDLAQEAFLKLWKFRNKIIENKSAFTLLYRIAINLAIDNLRGRGNLTIEQLTENICSDDLQIEDNEFNNILIECCQKLKPRQRAVFNLRDLEGLTYEEISEIMETSIGNVRSNLHLARDNVRKILFEVYQIDQEYFNEM